jgi:prepilin peptidase CpaA
MSHDEFEAMAGLIGRLLVDGRTGTLIVLLIVAAIIDLRTRRIPNRLVLAGAAFGLIYTTLVPPVMHGTIVFPLAGLLTGFVLFLPLYLLRVMGAGDVKLLAMAGSFLGPLDTLYCGLAAMIAGGALSILWALRNGTALRLLQNMASLLPLGLGAFAGVPSGMRMTPGASVGKLPYAVAVALGTITYLVLRQLGFI